MAFSTLLAFFGALSLAWPTWIEGLTGADPDGGSGGAEWWLVAIFLVPAVIAALLARRDRRIARLRSATAGGPEL